MHIESLHTRRVEPVKLRRLGLITDQCNELFDQLNQYSTPYQLDNVSFRALADETGVPVDNQGIILVGFSERELARRVERFVPATLEVCEMQWISGDLTRPRLDYVITVEWDDPLEAHVYDFNGSMWVNRLQTPPITGVSLAIGNDGIGFASYIGEEHVDVDFSPSLSLLVSKFAGGFKQALERKLEAIS